MQWVIKGTCHYSVILIWYRFVIFIETNTWLGWWLRPLEPGETKQLIFLMIESIPLNCLLDLIGISLNVTHTPHPPPPPPPPPFWQLIAVPNNWSKILTVSYFDAKSVHTCCGMVNDNKKIFLTIRKNRKWATGEVREWTTTLPSNLVNRALVNWSFQLDVGSFTLNLVLILECQIKIPISKEKFCQIFQFPVRPIFRSKAQMTFLCPLIINDPEISKVEYEDS